MLWWQIYFSSTKTLNSQFIVQKIDTWFIVIQIILDQMKFDIHLCQYFIYFLSPRVDLFSNECLMGEGGRTSLGLWGLIHVGFLHIVSSLDVHRNVYFAVAVVYFVGQWPYLICIIFILDAHIWYLHCKFVNYM